MRHDHFQIKKIIFEMSPENNLIGLIISVFRKALN